MNKKQIRLTESDLKQIVKESVNKILKESEGLDATPYLETNEFNRGFNPSQDKNDEINASWYAIDQEYGTPDIDFNDPYCSAANKLVYRDNGMTNGIYPLDDLSNPNVIDDDNYRSFWSYNDKISPEYFRKNESKNINKKLIRLTEQDLHRIVKESVEKIIKEHDMYALGRVSGRALERSADIARDMGRKGIQSPSEVSKMKNQDRIAHNANRLHNKLLGLNPDEEFGHINDEDFGNGMRDAAIDHKFRKRG